MSKGIIIIITIIATAAAAPIATPPRIRRIQQISNGDGLIHVNSNPAVQRPQSHSSTETETGHLTRIQQISEKNGAIYVNVSNIELEKPKSTAGNHVQGPSIEGADGVETFVGNLQSKPTDHSQDEIQTLYNEVANMKDRLIELQTRVGYGSGL